MSEFKIFNKYQECCGCEACMNACRQNAIIMKKDKYGFFYPDIDENKCVKCGQCKAVCSFTKPNKYGKGQDLAVYAAASKDTELLLHSSSGGIFGELANHILQNGGVVFGAAWNDKLEVHHIQVSAIDDLAKLHGSKYIQSHIGDSYQLAKNVLDNGKKVLYSGTPCQISGLMSYLRKDYSNLYTVDLICHGVGSETFLKEDVQYLAKGRTINKVMFRTKVNGWGTSGKLVLERNHEIPYNCLTSPYYYYYLDCAMFRDSCYHCRFSSEYRLGDLTLGDYWRIESAHPEGKNIFDLNKGVSCVLVNSMRGKELLKQISDKLILVESDIDKIKKRNAQLVKCCLEPLKRKALFSCYEKEGYDGIVQYWKKHEKKEKAVLWVKAHIPSLLKRNLKQIKK